MCGCLCVCVCDCMGAWPCGSSNSFHYCCFVSDTQWNIPVLIIDRFVCWQLEGEIGNWIASNYYFLEKMSSIFSLYKSNINIIFLYHMIDIRIQTEYCDKISLVKTIPFESIQIKGIPFPMKANSKRPDFQQNDSEKKNANEGVPRSNVGLSLPGIMGAHESGKNIFQSASSCHLLFIRPSSQPGIQFEQISMKKKKKTEEYAKTQLRTVIHLSVPLSVVPSVRECGYVPPWNFIFLMTI